MIVARIPHEDVTGRIARAVYRETATANGLLEHLTIRGKDFAYLVVASRARCVRGDGRIASLAGQVYGGTNVVRDCRGILRTISDAGTGGRLASTLLSLHGDFCCAIADARDDHLTLVASKVGLPPLYYHHDPSNGVLLASDDVETLLNVMDEVGTQPTLDRAYVGHFLTGLPDNAFSSGPAATAYAELKTVPPAHLMMVDEAPQRPTRYWTYWGKKRLSQRDAVESARATFLDAVKVRSTPGKAGVLLSGGLDSSSVACAMAYAHHGRPFFCYSNVFEQARSMNERFYAEAVVRHTGALARYVPADDHWALKDVPDLTRRPQPEPYQGWFHAQEVSIADVAREDGVEVILDGVGGDELFSPSLTGGRYEVDDTGSAVSKADNLERLRHLLLGSSRPSPAPSFDRNIVPPFLTEAFCSEVDLYERSRQPFEDLAALKTDPVTTRRLFSFHFLGNALADCVWASREVYGPRNIRRIQPFLDHRLVEVVFRIPVGELVSPSLEKPFLRKVLRDLLPDAVASRKLGVDFGEIFYRGIAEKEASKVIRLMDGALVFELGFVDRNLFEPFFGSFVRGNSLRTLADPFHEMHMWQVVALEMWMRDQWERGRLGL